MEKQYYRIKDIASIKSGKRLPAGHLFSDEPTSHPYIRSRDIKNGRILSSNLAYLEEETFQFIKKYIIEEGDVAITIVANIGDIGYCDTDCDKFNLTENAVRLTKFNQKIVDSQYLAFYLGQPFMKQYMESLAAGAAQAKLGIYKIEKIKVPLPKIEYQRRIASILSAYDNLIENNNRRIRLLEQMAENLYKEWFVRFRFPGHEKVEMENGLPKGWRYAKLEDVLSLKDSTRIPLSSIERSNMQKIYPYYGAASILDYVSDYLFDGVYLLLGEDGSVIDENGYPYIQYVWGKFWVNNHAHVIEKKGVYSVEFLYCMFKKMNIQSIVTGVAQPKISQGRLFNKKVIIPCDSIISLFDKQIQPIFAEIRQLTNQTANLTRQRDLLLPRLMSGKLEVNA